MIRRYIAGARFASACSFMFGRIAAIGLTLHASPMPQDSASTSASAIEYVNQALDLVQMHSINARKVDWASLRKEALAHAAGAQTTYDTYDAIRFALRSLNDHHSFLQLNDELARQDKESHARRGVAPMQPAGSEKWPPSPYIDRRTPEGEMVTVGGIRIAHLVVPLLENGDDARMQGYAAALQSYIGTLARQDPQGWVIDLRGNLGGNMWPMLAGIAPLIDAPEVGGFVDAAGNKTVWFIGADGPGLRKPGGDKEILCRVPERKISFRKTPVIAVLIDRGTASSGEAVAVALRGQARTRFIGRVTHGQTTANEGFRLSDGANLVLATGVEADRTGNPYPSGVAPDVELPEEVEKPKSSDSDPMLRAVAEWIKMNAGAGIWAAQ
jgi:carboxyl-terminal processing protease